MKKIISCVLTLAMLLSAAVLPARADTYPNPFGSGFNAIKTFSTGPLAETAIGSTGYKISTSAGSSSYNNAVVMDYATKATRKDEKDKYYPYGNGLAENGFYLFIGYGSGGSMTATLKLPEAAAAGKYIKVTYAKPKATNNGSTDRSSVNNTNELTVGTETVDLAANCEFDTWYTTTVKTSAAVEALSMKLGQWSAIAISNIEVADSADTMDFTAEKSLAYITSDNQTVQYTAAVYNSITTLMTDSEVLRRGAEDTSASVTYSVNGYQGVSIDESGLLTVTPQAQAGEVTVSASYGDVKKELKLTLETVGDADKVTIAGDEMVAKNGTLNLKAIPSVSGTVIPERAATWEIEGDAKGASVTQEGVFTAGAEAGNITVKATLNAAGKQTTAGVSDTFVVTVRDEAVTSPYTVKGVFLKDCAADLTTAKGVDGIAVGTDTVSAGYKAVVKALDANGIVIESTSVSLDSAPQGVSEIKTPLEFSQASQIKAYIINSNNEVVSEEIYKTAETIYRNTPIYPDWVQRDLGDRTIGPVGAPEGIDPNLVNISDLNVSYTYSNKPTPTADNVLWYDEGAYLAKSGNDTNSIYDMDSPDWEQKALPIGNGYMAGMLFGLPDKDQIQLNEETFWAAGYRGVQSSVASNNVNKNMSEGINGYMSVGNLFVDFNMEKGTTVDNYYRDLNLDEAVAHVQYELGGVKYKREYFATYPKQVLVFRYTADTADKLNFDVKPALMHPGDVTVNDGEITIIGKLKDSEPYSAGGKSAWNQESDLEYCTKIKVILDNGDNGMLTDGYNSVNVKNATNVTIIVAAATDYDKDQFELNADGSVNMTKTPFKSTRGVKAAIEKAAARMNGAASESYADLKAEHIADYTAQFGTVKFSLTPDNEICQTPTDELQSAYSKVIGTEKQTAVTIGKKLDKGEEVDVLNAPTNVSYNETDYKNLDKHLEELHFNYARYMMISSSRSTTMPATLQGKWCQSVSEIWGSCYCININMEMNYWFAGGANLADSTKSLIYWFKSQIPAGTVTAKNYYGVTPKSYTFNPTTKEMTFSASTDDKDDVFIMHTKQAIMGTTDLTGSTSIQSAGNSAWLMYNLWDLYQTTGDMTLLENDIYPIMRKLANFYTQYMYTKLKKTTTDTENYPDGYYYTTWEGRSPEQGPTQEGIKYDLQLVAGMYDYTIAAAKTLNVDADKVAAWEEIRNHLETPVELGEDNQIKEWKNETTYQKDSATGYIMGDPNHRHISHLVGLYPGTLINRSTQDFLDGAKIVLQNRGDDSTGWSCSNKFLLWARALEGDKALELFRYQLAKRTYSNLFDTHAPFQIDGNFGSAAGVMELLMQSQPLNQEQMNTQTAPIYLLPALPKVWDKGEISGIKAKNGAEVSIKWKNNKLTEATVTPAKDGALTLVYDDREYKIDNAKKDVLYTLADGEITSGEEKSIELTVNHVKASGYTGSLIVAGYAGNALVKSEIIDGYEANLTGYESCDKVKAFVWDSVTGMIPYGLEEIEAAQ